MASEISILGAGLAGLSAAICLKTYDPKMEVTVFERGSGTGSTHSNDFQQLDNWIDKKDVLEQILENTGIDISPAVIRAFNGMRTYSPQGKELDMGSQKPLFYTVKRGGKGSLDSYLAELALEKKVNIKFSSTIPENAASIVAFGAKRAQGMACGYKFHTDLPDGITGILDETIAPKDYAYLVVIGGEATMATVLYRKFQGAAECKEKAFKRFREHLGDFKAENLRSFAGFDAYRLVKSRKKESRLYVGSAGGFQDALFGFGMRQAILSGGMAAESICENKDYDKLWKNRLGKEHKNQVVLRMLFDHIGNRSYESVIGIFSKLQKSIGMDFSKGLHFAYTSGLVRSLYPLAKLYFGRKYADFTAL